MGEVERVLSEHGFSRRGEDVALAACSGGIDSIVLAHALVELYGARRVVIAHVDHAVREDSSTDALFVMDWARELGVQAVMRKLERGASSEDRLRVLRYRALEEMREEVGARMIMTAHTRDDQAETVLLGLLRSTRLARLGGMPARRGAIVRPMLAVPRTEVRAHAAARKLRWREDSTNVEPSFMRNRVRKELLPLLDRRYRRGISRRLSTLAAEVQRALSRVTAHAPPGPPPGNNIPARDTIDHRPRDPCDPAPPPPGDGSIRVALRPWKEGAPLPGGRSIAVFDADVLARPAIRPAAPGDRITPFGMDGRRKLGDVLREARIPTEQRRSIFVVTREDGSIVWVPGVVRSGDAPVGPLTRKVWVFWMDGQSSDGQAAQLQTERRSVTLDPLTTEGPGQDDE